MPTPPQVSSNPEVQAHYVTQLALSSALLAALRKLWPVVKPAQLAETFPTYRQGVSAVVGKFSLASISLSGDYYEALREDAGVTAPFRLPSIDPLSDEQIQAYLDTVVGDLASPAEFLAEFTAGIQQKVEAASQKVVADAGRAMVMGALEGDSAATGFARVARPGACAFCLLLAIRGAVYKSRATAGQLPPNTLGQVNRYHDNCNCGVEPLFDGDYQLPPHILAAQETFNDATARTRKGQHLNAFRRALAAERR